MSRRLPVRPYRPNPSLLTFVTVFAGGVAYPGNSSINFTGADQVANGVLSATNAAGQITIRGGGSPTHVIIDRIGFMV